MSPAASKLLFEYLVKHAKANYQHTATGQFGAYMQVSLCNDGLMTFMLRTSRYNLRFNVPLFI
jgi:D-tyrosyl-tRNA(Tyr) deacylase